MKQSSREGGRIAACLSAEVTLKKGQWTSHTEKGFSGDVKDHAEMNEPEPEVANPLPPQREPEENENLRNDNVAGIRKVDAYDNVRPEGRIAHVIAPGKSKEIRSTEVQILTTGVAPFKDKTRGEGCLFREMQ